MRKIITFMLLSGVIINIYAQQEFISERLTKKWETPRELKVPESVFYDNLRQIIYVSNVDGDPWAKDNSGFISKVTEEGKITNLKWITGLHAPKGMGVVGNLLYVSDVGRVAEIDITASKILRMIDIPGSEKLNDIATDGQGNVYVSDTETGSIYVIRQDKAELLVKSDKLANVNGLYVSEGNLLAGVKDRIVSINLKDKSIKDFILNTGGIDGLVPDGNGGFIISDWAGHVNIVTPKSSAVKLLDTTPVKQNAADIDYIITRKLLLVPTFFANSVVAYELK